MNKLSILITGFLICFCSSLFAQDGTTLHFMRLNPYSTNLNPSSYIQYKGYVGFPGISNINAAITNTSLHYDNIFITDASTGKITGINANKAIDNLAKDNNQVNLNLSLNILDFGFRVKDWNVSFAYRLRVDEYLFFNEDLIALPVNGNLSYAGAGNEAQPEADVLLNAYQEFAIGIRTDINEHWAIGFRPKLLFGIESLYSSDLSSTIYTDPTDYSLRLSTGINGRLMGFLPITVDSNRFTLHTDEITDNIGDMFRNVGAGIDLGVTYRINDNFGVAASVLDLGFITWSTKAFTINSSIDSAGSHYSSGNFILDGLTIDEINNWTEHPEEFNNTLAAYFPTEITSTTDRFTRALNGRFTIEGYYNLGEHHRFSALFQGRIVKNQFLPSLTVAWNGNFLNIFDLCVSYSIAKKSYTNLGIGVGFNLGVFHLYAVTDNILGLCTAKSVQRSLLNTSNFSAQVGIVFDWGKLPQKSAGSLKAKEKPNANDNDKKNDNDNDNDNDKKSNKKNDKNNDNDNSNNNKTDN